MASVFAAAINLLPLPALNSSLAESITPKTLVPPIYHTASPSLIPNFTDKHLSLFAPVIIYWVFSLVFHFLDTHEFSYFEKMRIHEPEEIKSKNRATIMQVINAVVLQQVVQTLLGFLWLESEETILEREVYLDHLKEMGALAGPVGKVVILALGDRTGQQVLMKRGAQIVQWVYWWGIPALQLWFAFFLIDTWQYFLHRLFHTVPFLYRHFHSVHHRLYVPYAFGALYNHPVEGLVLDSLGAAIAHSASLMTIRQAVLLFSVSTLKTVDDHCGYQIWWDPCQWIFANNADYHDIHHQSWGIKKNFSQPFFTSWDKILGTRLTREEHAVKKSTYYASQASSSQSSIPSTTSANGTLPLPIPAPAAPPILERVSSTDSGVVLESTVLNYEEKQLRDGELRKRKGEELGLSEAHSQANIRIVETDGR